VFCAALLPADHRHGRGWHMIDIASGDVGMLYAGTRHRVAPYCDQ